MLHNYYWAALISRHPAAMIPGIRARLCVISGPSPLQLVDRTTSSIYQAVNYRAVNMPCRYDVTADCSHHLDRD